MGLLHDCGLPLCPVVRIMRKLLLLLPLITLLTACQSKREICAKYSADQLTIDQAASKLGLRTPAEKRYEFSWMRDQELQVMIQRYSVYYTS